MLFRSNKTNTNDITPKFHFDENRISNVVQSSITDHIVFDDGVNSGPEEAALDDSQTGSRSDVIITVNSVTKIAHVLFQNEIYRILRKNRPAHGARIKKENNTEDSPIMGYDFPLPKFTVFDAEKQQIDAIITEYHSKPTTLDKQEEPEFLTKEWFDKYFAAIVAGVVAVTMSATAVFVYREKTPDFQKPSKHIQKNNA